MADARAKGPLRAIIAAVAVALLAATPASADTLRVALSAQPGPFDPAVAPSPEQLAPVGPAYQRLVGPDGRPQLARSWRSDADGRVWTFEIASSARFDDGRVVDAAAVVFSLRRLVAVGRGPSSELASILDRVEAVGATTVRLTLKAPSPHVPQILAARSAAIVNPAVAAHDVNGDQATAWLATRSAGSGPYRVVATGPAVTLARNPYYSGPPPAFDEIVFQVIADPTVRALAVARGDVDVAFLMPSQTLKRLRTDRRVVVHAAPAFAFQNVAFNMERPVFADRRLRAALAMAIDTEAIVRDIRGGSALVFRGPIPVGIPGADPSAYPIRYDPAAAVRLAREVGGKPRRVVMIYPGVSPETDTVAQYIQAVAAPLGLQVRLERLSIPAYLDRMQRGAYDLVLQGFVAPTPDISSVLGAWFDAAKVGVDNPARYVNPKATALLASAARELDANKRAQVYADLALLVNRDLPYIYLQQTKVTNVVRADIEGYRLDGARALDLPLETLRRRR